MKQDRLQTQSRILRWSSMGISAFILIPLLLVGGCATSHPEPSAAQISEKRQELVVLCSEFEIISYELSALQAKLSTNSAYSPAAQARDLNDSIAIVRQARDKLAAQYRGLHDAFHVYDGGY